VSAALGRYRLIAWVVGVELLVLVFAALPLNFFAHRGAVVTVVGPLHGFLYIVYLLVAVDLAGRRHWSLSRTALVLLAGTVPLLTFVVARQVIGEKFAAGAGPRQLGAQPVAGFRMATVRAARPVAMTETVLPRAPAGRVGDATGESAGATDDDGDDDDAGARHRRTGGLPWRRGGQRTGWRGAARRVRWREGGRRRGSRGSGPRLGRGQQRPLAPPRTTPAAMTAALGRYRLMSWVVGLGLLVLVLVGLPLKYLAHNPTVVAVVGPVHGFLYIVYLLAALDLATRRRWTLPRTVLVLLAGTVPFLTFAVERRVTREVTS
jgi:integral membrane protein